MAFAITSMMVASCHPAGPGTPGRLEPAKVRPAPALEPTIEPLPETSTPAPVPTGATTPSEERRPQSTLKGVLHDADQKAMRVGGVRFVIRDSEAPGRASPYVSLGDAERDIARMDHADKIVIREARLVIVVDYPLEKAWAFEIAASSPDGFRRGELAQAIATLFDTIYAEEERTSANRTVPIEERAGLENRNTTTGIYGIWGHDRVDLVLRGVNLWRREDGTLFGTLLIDS